MEDVERPEEVFFTVAGRPVEFKQFECTDRIADAYEFAFLLAPETRLGIENLVVRVSGRELAPIPIEIAGLSEPAKLWGGEAENQQRGKRNLTSALTRWLHGRRA
jgi:hypothetical protein